MSARFSRFQSVVAAVQVLLGLALFASPVFGQTKPRSLYDGAAVRFEFTHLAKPREQADLGLAFTLAPLLIHEVNPTNSFHPPTNVFCHEDSVVLNERSRSRLTYWWRYDDAKIRGLRITLNTNGSPAIYEIFGETRPVAQIFVSQSLEAAARAEFGAALPGRRFAVERSLADAPGIVVSRVLDEPSTVMGPIVYLTAESQDVATLICRCMESQAKTVLGKSNYELVPSVPPHPIDPSKDFLEKKLRLPKFF